jgi:hypothetical protein
VTVDFKDHFPRQPLSILDDLRASAPSTLAQLYDQSFTCERNAWWQRTTSLLSVVDPIVRTLCGEYGFRFNRQSLSDFLSPEQLFKLAFCSNEDMHDLFYREDMVRLRATFATLPRIDTARDIDEVLSDVERFLHPLDYVSMPAQAWLQQDACVIPGEDVDLAKFLADGVRHESATAGAR